MSSVLCLWLASSVFEDCVSIHATFSAPSQFQLQVFRRVVVFFMRMCALLLFLLLLLLLVLLLLSSRLSFLAVVSVVVSVHVSVRVSVWLCVHVCVFGLYV